MRVWITKYALTKGIIEAEARLGSESDKMIAIIGASPPMYFHAPDWHTSEEAARARVSAMIVAKRSSLQKQLKRLDDYLFGRDQVPVQKGF